MAFDLTDAVEKTKEVCSEFNNIHYLQADIYELPICENSFDIVYCHGVLMTTPDIKAATREISKRVCDGGELAILVYRGLSLPQRTIDNMLCSMTKRLPLKWMYYLSLIPTLLEYIPGVVTIFENIIHLSGQPKFSLKWLHNFDWYTCRHRHRTSVSEAESWMREFGFCNFREQNTNRFRVKSRFRKVAMMKQRLLEKELFLKATLGVRATRC